MSLSQTISDAIVICFLAFVGDVQKTFLQKVSTLAIVIILDFYSTWMLILYLTCFEVNKMKKYSICLVLLVVTSLSLMLFLTIIHHIDKYNHDRDFVKQILCFLQIDDLSSAEKDVNNAHEFFCKCKDRLNNGNFNFRKFRSNSARLKMLVKMKYTLNDDIKPTTEN